MYFMRFKVLTQVSGFKFQVSSDSDQTHLPAWKAVQSAAMVAWDEVSGK